MRFVICCFVILWTSVASAQITIPQVTYASRADYAAQEDKVLEVIAFLRDSPAGEHTDLRQRAGRYLISWLEGTPAVTVEIESFIQPFMNHGEALLIFMGGYAEHALTHGGQPSRMDLNLAATGAVVDYYVANKATIGRHKKLDRLAKLKEKGKLRRWIAGRLSRK
jgi:hypothetical protein